LVKARVPGQHHQHLRRLLTAFVGHGVGRANARALMLATRVVMSIHQRCQQ
jgi:hypothetical protein